MHAVITGLDAEGRITKFIPCEKASDAKRKLERATASGHPDAFTAKIPDGARPHDVIVDAKTKRCAKSPKEREPRRKALDDVIQDLLEKNAALEARVAALEGAQEP